MSRRLKIVCKSAVRAPLPSFQRLPYSNVSSPFHRFANYFKVPRNSQEEEKQGMGAKMLAGSRKLIQSPKSIVLDKISGLRGLLKMKMQRKGVYVDPVYGVTLMENLNKVKNGNGNGNGREGKREVEDENSPKATFIHKPEIIVKEFEQAMWYFVPLGVHTYKEKSTIVFPKEIHI